MMNCSNFVYPVSSNYGKTLKLQPDKTWMEYAKKIVDERGTAEDAQITAEEAADFLWESIKAAIDMLGEKKTYAEYVLETSLKGLPKWAQIEEQTWNKLNEDVTFGQFVT